MPKPISLKDIGSMSDRFFVLGDYFRDSVLADIDSLAFFGGVHEMAYGYHRMLAKRFPFVVYYERKKDAVTVVAVLDARRDPSWTRDRLA